jgi:hypothetical protein
VPPDGFPDASSTVNQRESLAGDDEVVRQLLSGYWHSTALRYPIDPGKCGGPDLFVDSRHRIALQD